jgi:hypothetical protein
MQTTNYKQREKQEKEKPVWIFEIAGLFFFFSPFCDLSVAFFVFQKL